MANLCIKTPKSATYVLIFQLLVLRPRPSVETNSKDPLGPGRGGWGSVWWGGRGGWGRCGGRAGVKDSLRAVTRGPPSPLSRTSPTPKAGPDRQAAAILNGLSQNRPIYLKFFLNLSQILSTLLQNPMCSAQAKQRLHKSFTKRDERSKESYKTCVDCSKHRLLQLSSCWGHTNPL